MTTGKLHRILGVGFGLAVIIGNTIGAGILRTPGEIAAGLPNEWLFLGVWVLGGLYALVGSFSIAELGTAIPRAGGQYAFARRAIGPYAGFVVGWSDWISTCGSAAAVAIVVGEYSAALFPALGGYEVPIALLVTVVFALVQWRGVVWGGRTQEFTSLLKAAAFVIFIAACFALGGGGGEAAGPRPPLAAGLAIATAVVVALQAVIYTYDGWTGVVYFSEEVKDPGRDIPRAMFGGVLAVIAIYVLVNAALLYVLPIERLGGAEFAAGLAAEAMVGPAGERVIRGLVILSMFSAVNALLLMGTRTIFALGRDGLFAQGAARINRGGTPSVALLVSAGVAVAFLLTGTFQQVIAVLAFFFVTNYAISFVCLFLLRRREPKLHRPYRAWGYPWTTAIALAGSLAFLAAAVAGDTRNSLYALGLLAVSYPVYRLTRRAARHVPRKPSARVRARRRRAGR